MKTLETRNIVLTERQKSVLKLVADGLKNEEIAKRLFISIHTVKAHLCSLYNILKVSSRVNLIIRALKLNLLDLDKIA